MSFPSRLSGRYQACAHGLSSGGLVRIWFAASCCRCGGECKGSATTRRAQNPAVRQSRTDSRASRRASVIRQIFKLFVTEDKSEQGIADLLNQRKVRPESNFAFSEPTLDEKPHTPDPDQSEIRRNKRLQQKVNPTPPKGTDEPAGTVGPQGRCLQVVIPLDLYIQAQKIVSFRHEMTDYKILEHLRSLLKRSGKLTARLINNDIATPSAITVIRHFGS